MISSFISHVKGYVNDDHDYDYKFNDRLEWDRKKETWEAQKRRDAQPARENIFANNQLYFMKCKELEAKLSGMYKINNFLISQVLQSFPTNPSQKFKPTSPSKATEEKFVKNEINNTKSTNFDLFEMIKF